MENQKLEKALGTVTQKELWAAKHYADGLLTLTYLHHQCTDTFETAEAWARARELHDLIEDALRGVAEGTVLCTNR